MTRQLLTTADSSPPHNPHHRPRNVSRSPNQPLSHRGPETPGEVPGNYESALKLCDGGQVKYALGAGGQAQRRLLCAVRSDSERSGACFRRHTLATGMKPRAWRFVRSVAHAEYGRRKGVVIWRAALRHLLRLLHSAGFPSLLWMPTVPWHVRFVGRSAARVHPVPWQDACLLSTFTAHINTKNHVGINSAVASSPPDKQC
jgi:hypothetical protein